MRPRAAPRPPVTSLISLTSFANLKTTMNTIRPASYRAIPRGYTCAARRLSCIGYISYIVNDICYSLIIIGVCAVFGAVFSAAIGAPFVCVIWCVGYVDPGLNSRIQSVRYSWASLAYDSVFCSSRLSQRVQLCRSFISQLVQGCGFISRPAWPGLQILISQRVKRPRCSSRRVQCRGLTSLMSPLARHLSTGGPSGPVPQGPDMTSHTDVIVALSKKPIEIHTKGSSRTLDTHQRRPVVRGVCATAP
jgi:hypothetical protein